MPSLPFLAAFLMLLGTATSSLSDERPTDRAAEIDQAIQTRAAKITDGEAGGENILCVQRHVPKDSLLQFQALHFNPNLIMVADCPGGDQVAAVRMPFSLFDLYSTIVIPHPGSPRKSSR